MFLFTRPAGTVQAPRRTCSIYRVFLFLFTLYLIPPLLLYFSTWLQDALIFVHHLRTPYFANHSDPASFGLIAAREFELTQEDGCIIKTWQMLPASYYHSDGFLGGTAFINALSDGLPIVIYMHGNTGTRAISHRVELYKYIAGTFGYHVITFDYRGFGDSTCYPSEQGMMEDAGLVWKWVREKAPRAKVYIWGHSLGTSAATHLTAELCQDRDLPSGLILDAPFPNMIAAAENHPFSIPYWPIMPLFSRFVLQNIQQKFETSKHFDHISVPILILHGQQDVVIPIHLGKEVYRMALKSREQNPTWGRVDFVDCGPTGHRSNWESPMAREALKQFVLHQQSDIV